MLFLLLACPSPEPTPEDSEAPLEFADLALEADADFPTLLTPTWTQTQPAEVTVAWRVPGEDWHEAPAVEVELEGERRIVGLPYGHEVEVVLRSGELESEAVGLQLEELPVGFPRVVLDVNEGGDPAFDWVLASVAQSRGGWNGGRHWAFILDRQGRVVWLRETPEMAWTLYARPSLDGRALLLDEGTFWQEWDGGEDARVQRIRLDGSIEHTWLTPGLQHSYDELPDGRLAYGAARTRDEALVLVDQDDEVVEVWTCKEGTEAQGEWCYSNTVSYDAVGHRFLFSIPDANQVAEIDADSFETIAVYGNESVYRFEPVESAFKWQHGSVFDQDGHLLVSTHSNGVAETVVRAYAIDHDSQTLTQVYSFGEGLEVHAEYGGTVVRSEAGYLLQEMGSAGVLREGSPEGELVWQVDFDGPRQLGRADYLADLYALLD